MPEYRDGAWKVLWHGHPSASGGHSFGPNDEEWPADDPMERDWSDGDIYRPSAFPGENGDGSDCAPEIRKVIEDTYRGRRCALLYKESPCSSYHYCTGDFYFLIDLPDGDLHALEDQVQEMDENAYVPLGTFHPNRGSAERISNLDYTTHLGLFEEFTYTTFEQIKAIAKSRNALPNEPVPQKPAFNKPKPEENSADYWTRQITRAEAPDWQKKKDGD